MRATKKGEHFISLSLSLSFPFAHTLSGRCRATLRVPLLRVRLGASFLCVCACVRCALSLPHPQRRDMSTAQLAHFHFSSGHWRQTSLPRFRLLCLPHFLTYWPRSCTILFLSPPTLCRCGPRPRSPYEKKFSWVAAWSPLASFLFSPSSYNFLQRECALLEISLRKPALKTTPASSPGSLWGILVVLGLPSAVSRPHNAPSASTLSLRYFLSLLESNLFSSSTEQIRVFSPIQSSSPSLSLHARVCFGLTGSPPPHPHRVLVDVPSDLSRQKTASHFWSATFFFFALSFGLSSTTTPSNGSQQPGSTGQGKVRTRSCLACSLSSLPCSADIRHHLVQPVLCVLRIRLSLSPRFFLYPCSYHSLCAPSSFCGWDSLLCPTQPPSPYQFCR